MPPRTHTSLNWPLYGLLWLAMMVLRQDFWFWTDKTLLFGVLPIGLAWQVGYSILAAVILAGLVRWQWPHELERLDDAPDREIGR